MCLMCIHQLLFTALLIQQGCGFLSQPYRYPAPFRPFGGVETPTCTFSNGIARYASSSSSGGEGHEEAPPFFARVQDTETTGKVTSSTVPKMPQSPKTPPPVEKTPKSLERSSTIELVQGAANKTVSGIENEIERQITSVENEIEKRITSVEEEVERTRRQVLDEVERRKQEVEKTVEDVKAIPSKVKISVDETKAEVERRKQEVEKTVEDIKAIPSKVKMSVDETKRKVAETVETIDRTAKEIQAIPGKAKQSYFETRDQAYEIYDGLVEIPGKVEKAVEETKMKVDNTVATVKRSIDAVSETANAFKDFASGLAGGKADPKKSPKTKPTSKLEVKAPAVPGKSVEASESSTKGGIDINDEINDILKLAEEAIQGADDVLSESITKK